MKRKLITVTIAMCMLLSACNINKEAVKETVKTTVKKADESSREEEKLEYERIGDIAVTVDGIDIKLRSICKDIVNFKQWEMQKSLVGNKDYNENYIIEQNDANITFSELVDFKNKKYSDIVMRLELTNNTPSEDKTLKDCIITEIIVDIDWVGKEEPYKIPDVSIGGLIKLQDSIEHCIKVLGEPSKQENYGNTTYLTYTDSKDSNVELKLSFTKDLGLITITIKGTRDFDLEY